MKHEQWAELWERESLTESAPLQQSDRAEFLKLLQELVKKHNSSKAQEKFLDYIATKRPTFAKYLARLKSDFSDQIDNLWFQTSSDIPSNRTEQVTDTLVQNYSKKVIAILDDQTSRDQFFANQDFKKFSPEDWQFHFKALFWNSWVKLQEKFDEFLRCIDRAEFEKDTPENKIKTLLSYLWEDFKSIISHSSRSSIIAKVYFIQKYLENTTGGNMGFDMILGSKERLNYEELIGFWIESSLAYLDYEQGKINKPTFLHSNGDQEETPHDFHEKLSIWRKELLEWMGINYHDLQSMNHDLLRAKLKENYPWLSINFRWLFENEDGPKNLELIETAFKKIYVDGQYERSLAMIGNKDKIWKIEIIDQFDFISGFSAMLIEHTGTNKVTLAIRWTNAPLPISPDMALNNIPIAFWFKPQQLWTLQRLLNTLSTKYKSRLSWKEITVAWHSLGWILSQYVSTKHIKIPAWLNIVKTINYNGVWILDEDLHTTVPSYSAFNWDTIWNKWRHKNIIPISWPRNQLLWQHSIDLLVEQIKKQLNDDPDKTPLHVFDFTKT